MDRPDRRIAPRVAIAEDLRDTVLRCHDHLYGNQSMQAPRVFAEMVKLIFSKIYDERLVRARSGHTRQFWVGVTERNTPEGRRAIATRVRAGFKQMKRDPDLGSAFREHDEIELKDAPLAWVASELSRYQLLDAKVDVKGMAYEHIQKSLAALSDLTPSMLAGLAPGEAFAWANRATSGVFTRRAVKLRMRPRATRHGGSTRLAVEP